MPSNEWQWTLLIEAEPWHHFSVTLLLDAASSLHINVIVISIIKILTVPLRKE